MPSKRKRSGPGFNRDAPSNSTFKRSKPAYNQVYRLSSRNITGPGIFVTCVQGKERKAALQFIDILNEVADRLFPGVKPEPLPETSTSEKQDADGEEDMDALRNGAIPTTIAEKPTPTATAAEEKSKEGGGDDIAAQIAAELKDIKSSERQRSSSSNPARFKNIETDTECFLFISVSPPFDPYLLVYTILSDVEASGEPRSRFVQRLTPVTATSAANAEDLTSLARTVLPQYFSTNPEEGKTFKIDPRIRSHSKLKRNDVIQIVASNIPTAPAEEEGGERRRIHNANLTNPDLWIVVEIVKNSTAISVVRDYERYRKLNLQSVAQAANEGKAKEQDSGEGKGEGRIAASLVKKAPVPAAEEANPEGGEEVEEAATGTVAAEEEKAQAQEEANPAEEAAAGEEAQMSNFKLF